MTDLPPCSLRGEIREDTCSCSSPHWNTQNGFVPLSLCGRCPYRNRTDKPVVDPTVVVRPGLGDWLAGLLARVGVTAERIERLTGKPCGCDARRKWLNQVGERVARFVRRKQ